jgi:hypothetical protein
VRGAHISAGGRALLALATGGARVPARRGTSQRKTGHHRPEPGAESEPRRRRGRRVRGGEGGRDAAGPAGGEGGGFASGPAGGEEGRDAPGPAGGEGGGDASGPAGGEGGGAAPWPAGDEGGRVAPLPAGDKEGAVALGLPMGRIVGE